MHSHLILISTQERVIIREIYLESVFIDRSEKVKVKLGAILEIVAPITQK